MRNEMTTPAVAPPDMPLDDDDRATAAGDDDALLGSSKTVCGGWFGGVSGVADTGVTGETLKVQEKIREHPYRRKDDAGTHTPR